MKKKSECEEKMSKLLNFNLKLLPHSAIFLLLSSADRTKSLQHTICHCFEYMYYNL